MFSKKVLFLIIIVFFTLFARAGWVISEISSDKYGNKQYQTTFIQNNMIRFETQSSVAIINLKSSNITLVFGMYQLYWQGSVEDLRKSTMDVFEQKLQNIVLTADPEQREIARELIAEMRNEKPKNDSIIYNLEIKETDSIENIAGFEARKYEIMVSNVLTETIWITDSINPYLDIDIESMISFTNQLKPDKVVNSIGGSSEYLNLIKKGLAVKSQEINPTDGFRTTIVERIIETNINNDIFSPPSNYRKAKLAEIMLIKYNNSNYYKLEQEFQKAKDNPLYD
jgi:hypothetical protein